MSTWPWSAPCTLYGMPVSLYTGKARSYLRKQHIPYVERLPIDPRYGSVILPVIKRMIFPVVELPDGEIIQDTTDIIDRFERGGLARLPCYPQTPRQRLVALTAELFGDEGLTRMAMHFRWSFPSVNESFIRREFAGFMAPTAPLAEQDERAEMPMLAMQSYLPRMGIGPHSAPAIEAAHADLLAVLEAHFLKHPFLLGGRASIGDFGLIGPLYAHLGRDPHPALLMKQRAPRVARWVERMNAPDADMPEYPDGVADAFLPDDTVPEMLLPLLSLIAADYLPELRALVAFIDGWLAENPVSEGDPVGPRPERRAIGSLSFEFRGVRIDSWAVPYTLHMLQRVTDAFAALALGDQASAHALFDTAGLADLLTLKAVRRVERAGQIEVWGRSG